MSLFISTGLRSQMLVTNPLHTIMNLGFINIYDGAPPGDADAALNSSGTNNLLVTISNNATATGLTFEPAAVGGAIVKETTETWSGTVGTGGTATFYRHVAVGDTGVASTGEARIQGSIGVSGEAMNLSDTLLVGAATQTITDYTVSIPSS